MSSVAAPPEQEGKLPPSRADTQAEIRSAGTIKAFNFFVYGAIAVYSTYFPLYLQGIGMSKIQIGALLAGGPFISLLANPFWGYWSDRLRNIKRMLLLMLIGNLLVMQAVFQLGSIPFIYGAMLVFFFFQMPLFSQTNSLILNSIEGTRHKFGAFRLWGSLGWALLAVGSGPAVAALGVNRLWVVYTLLMLVSIGFALALPKGESKKKEGFSNSGYGKVFTNRAFLMLVLLGVLISVPNSMNMTFVAIFISEMGGKEALIGWSAFLSSIFEIPIFFAARPLFEAECQHHGCRFDHHQRLIHTSLAADVRRGRSVYGRMDSRTALPYLWRLLLHRHPVDLNVSAG